MPFWRRSTNWKVKAVESKRVRRMENWNWILAINKDADMKSSRIHARKLSNLRMRTIMKFSIRTAFSTICTLIFLSLTWSHLHAQDELPTSEVEVVKQFEARLVESNRINIQPEKEVVQPLPLNFEYEVLNHQEEVTYNPPEIKPRGYRTGRGPEIYRGFLKAGAGWPLNYLGQFGYRFDIDRQRNANIFADLRGLNDGQVDDRKVMNATIQGDANYYTDLGLKLSGFAGFKRRSEERRVGKE